MKISKTNQLLIKLHKDVDKLFSKYQKLSRYYDINLTIQNKKYKIKEKN